jgi:hypothetical protein
MAHQTDEVELGPMPIGPTHGFAIDRLAMPGTSRGGRRHGLVEALDELSDARF